MNPLLDRDFLKELDNFNNRETYARITALTVNEFPVETIEGRVTGGTINIDGTSAVRRTCSLSLIAQDVNINNFYWGLNNKIKVEIGLKNFINELYPDIIWFPQGIYIITGFNTSLSNNGFNISLNGKDKMCLLNGDVGGSLPASVDFGVEEIHNGDTITYKDIPIKNIIKELLHTYALEPYYNIIINDLDDKGLELLEYRGSDPMYMTYYAENKDGTTSDNSLDMPGTYTNFYFADMECFKLDGSKTSFSQLEYNSRVDDLTHGNPTKITLTKNGNKIYTVAKIEFGQTAGYRLTDLTYAGELISGIGESITSILDKIVNMLGNFEYFYDVDGRFIFQSKKTYVNTSWDSTIEIDEDIYVQDSAYADSNIYRFEGNNLIQSFSNNPDLGNLKNDYVIWGNRKSISGAQFPIHFRYAIHKKPVFYKSLGNNGQGGYGGEPTDSNKEIKSNLVRPSTTYYSLDADIPDGNGVRADWRELIYQMAYDYYEHNQKDDFYLKIIESNLNYYPTGMTGYEQFYQDMQGFWRQMYNPVPSLRYFEFNYKSDDSKTFEPLDEKNNIIPEIFIKDKYTKLTADDNDKIEDRMNVYILKTYTDEDNNQRVELQRLIDTIKIDYNFNDEGNQTQEIYFVTADTEDGYKAITRKTYPYIEKKEIYVKSKDNEGKNVYTHILKTVSLENCYLKESLGEDDYINIFADEDNENLPNEIKALYIASESDNEVLLNKYYTISPLDIKGEVIPDANVEKKYFTYYITTYDYFRTEDGVDPNVLFWHKNIRENPDELNFWIDFMDSSNPNNNHASELDSYAISTIGDRPKVVNDTNVKSIYYRNVPNVIFVTDFNDNAFKDKTGYIFMRITEDMGMNYFSISTQGKSAKDALDELLYKHSYCTESINISAIPIYYLEPNAKISVYDSQSKINGEYIVSRISLPLTYNGQMSISATKAPQRF